MNIVCRNRETRVVGGTRVVVSFRRVVAVEVVRVDAIGTVGITTVAVFEELTIMTKDGGFDGFTCSGSSTWLALERNVSSKRLTTLSR